MVVHIELNEAVETTTSNFVFGVLIFATLLSKKDGRRPISKSLSGPDEKACTWDFFGREIDLKRIPNA